MTCNKLIASALTCGASAPSSRTTLRQAQESVTLITDFGYNGRHAYFFVALEKGYYKEAGLDVKIVRGQGSVDAIRQTGAGNAMFGFADAGSLTLARANDQIPVKLVAIVYAKPPQAIFCREDAGLKQAKDLEGQSIANPAGGSIPDMFPAFAKAAGIEAAKCAGWSPAATRCPDCWRQAACRASASSPSASRCCARSFRPPSSCASPTRMPA